MEVKESKIKIGCNVSEALKSDINEENNDVSIYETKKNVNFKPLTNIAKDVIKYLTEETGSVAAAVQIFGYEHTALALHFMGKEIGAKNEYFV